MPEGQSKTITPDALPDVITRYLKAHRVHDKATAITAFTGDATVIDDGNTYRGTAAIESWLGKAAAEFTYTSELTGAQRVDATHYVATPHLEGDFAGGTVDLHYRFALRGDLVERLVIEP